LHPRRAQHPKAACPRVAWAVWVEWAACPAWATTKSPLIQPIFLFFRGPFFCSLPFAYATVQTSALDRCSGCHSIFGSVCGMRSPVEVSLLSWLHVHERGMKNAILPTGRINPPVVRMIYEKKEKNVIGLINRRGNVPLLR
jgi:hypothetical protein